MATFQEGTIRNESLTVYDVVIANINRNILLDEMAEYVLRLASNGYLFLSGFYTEDIPHIREAALLQGLALESETNLRNWACLRLRKS
jgi:ribosomal protein L11 methyltransferase